jgi:hypothetical protein
MHRRAIGFLLPTLIACLGADGVRAQGFTFQADDGVMIVRGRQAGADARFELLADRDGRLQCVALSGQDQPLAVQSTFAKLGFVRFADMRVDDIARVVCRYRN